MLTAFRPDHNAVALVVEINDFLAGFQRDELGQFIAGLEQGAVQIGTMDNRIGIFEPGKESLVEVDPRDDFSRDTVPHHEHFGKHRERPHAVGHAKLLEHPEDIRTELDPGADLTEFGGLFEQQAVEPLAGEREGASKATNAAADDDEWMFLLSHRFTLLAAPAQAARTLTCMEPIPSIRASMVSPATTRFTPSGVPVIRISPGCSV